MTGEKQWKMMERVVGALERSLIPGASVKVNYKLPNLVTRELEQFDAVIWSGPSHRQTLSVVEVQKRNRKVKANEYRGWCQKRMDVGAQHLICVSEKGFPDSVVKDAKYQGDTVRLLTLEELEGKNWPFQIAGQALVFVEDSYQLKSLKIKTDISRNTYQVKRDDPIFKCIKGGSYITPVDLGKVITKSWFQVQFLPDGLHYKEIDYIPDSDNAITILLDGIEHPVRRVLLGVNVKVARIRLPLTCSQYVPVKHGNAIAYALMAGGTVSGNDVRIRIIFHPEHNGLLRFTRYEVDGLPEKSFAGFGIIKAVIGKANSPYTR